MPDTPSTQEWTAARIEALWTDLEGLKGERLTKLLRRRFRHEVDARALTESVLGQLAEVFNFWGVLEARESWALAALERREGLERARSAFADAATLAGGDGASRGFALFNGGLVTLLKTLTPHPGMSLFLSFTGGPVDAPLPHVPSNEPMVDDLREAYRLFVESRHEEAAPLADLVAALLGCVGPSRPVRERLDWLQKAQRAVGAIGDLAAREQKRLRELSWWTRTLGHSGRSSDLGAILPIEISLAVFLLPERAERLLR